MFMNDDEWSPRFCDRCGTKPAKITIEAGFHAGAFCRPCFHHVAFLRSLINGDALDKAIREDRVKAEAAVAAGRMNADEV